MIAGSLIGACPVGMHALFSPVVTIFSPGFKFGPLIPRQAAVLTSGSRPIPEVLRPS